MAGQMDKLHRDVQKRYHTLCSLLGMSRQDKEAVLAPYGVTSSSDMETHDLIDVCGALDKELATRNNKAHAELDSLRKRAMAAIGSWLKHEGKQGGIGYIKAIACRSTGHKDFNRIPPERLRNLIGLYNNKVKDADSVREIKKNIKQPATAWVGEIRPAGEA